MTRHLATLLLATLALAEPGLAQESERERAVAYSIDDFQHHARAYQDVANKRYAGDSTALFTQAKDASQFYGYVTGVLDSEASRKSGEQIRECLRVTQVPVVVSRVAKTIAEARTLDRTKTARATAKFWILFACDRTLWESK